MQGRRRQHDESGFQEKTNETRNRGAEVGGDREATEACAGPIRAGHAERPYPTS